jgi:hypothetical protein
MGRGNKQVNKDEAIFYVDNTYFEAYYLDENDKPTTERDYDLEVEYMNDFLTNLQWDKKLLEHFIVDKKMTWFNDYRVLFYNDYFKIVAVDNEWAMGVALIQIEPHYSLTDDEVKTFEDEKIKRFNDYKVMLIKALYQYIPELYIPNGAWMSSKLDRGLYNE